MAKKTINCNILIEEKFLNMAVSMIDPENLVENIKLFDEPDTVDLDIGDFAPEDNFLLIIALAILGAKNQQKERKEVSDGCSRTN